MSVKTGYTTAVLRRQAKDGINGTNAITCDLTNEMDSLSMDVNGYYNKDMSVSTIFKLYNGTTQLQLDDISYDLGYNESLLEGKNPALFINKEIDLNGNLTGVIMITSYPSSSIKPFDNTGNDNVTITITGKSGNIERSAVFTINGIRAAKEGENAVIYQLVPSLTAIKINKTGSYVDTQLECVVHKIDGSDITIDTSKTVMMSIDNGGEETYKAITLGNTNPQQSVKYTLYDGTTILDRETIPVIADGTDATSYVADLSNEMSGVACDDSNHPTAESKPITKAKLMYGTTTLTTKITSIAATNGIDLSNYGISVNDSAGTIGEASASVHTLTFTVNKWESGNTALPSLLEITISLECTEGEHNGATGECTFSILPSQAGANGESPKIYDIVPSQDEIVFNRDANGNLTPENQTLTVQMRTTIGEDTSVADIPAGFRLQYSNSESPTSIDEGTKYEDSITVANTDTRIYLSLFQENDGNYKLIDKESIPIIKDGAKGNKGEDGEDAITIDLDNQMDALPTDVNGLIVTDKTITTNIRMYKGSTQISGDELMAPNGDLIKINDIIPEVVNSSDVITIKWTFKVSDTSYDGTYIVNIPISYNEIFYYTTFTLVVQKSAKPGESPIIYQLNPSDTAIKVTEDSTYTPKTIACKLNVYNGNSNEDAKEIPTGYLMHYRIDENNEEEYTYGDSINTENIKTNIVFMLIKDDDSQTLIDIETIPVVKDGSTGNSGADAVQPNLYGYDCALTGTCIASEDIEVECVHTKTGLAGYFTSGDETASSFGVAVALKMEKGRTYAISGVFMQLPKANDSDIDLSSLLIYCNDGSVAKIKENPSKEGDKFVATITITSTSATLFVIGITNLSTTLKGVFEISNLKVEDVTSLNSTYTSFNGLASDSIAQNQNLIVDSQFANSKKWDVFNGERVLGYQGVYGFKSPEFTVNPEDSSALKFYVAASDSNTVAPTEWTEWTTESVPTFDDNTEHYLWIQLSNGEITTYCICLGLYNPTGPYENLENKYAYLITDMYFSKDNSTWYTYYELSTLEYKFEYVKYTANGEAQQISIPNEVLTQSFPGKMKPNTWYTLSFMHKCDNNTDALIAFITTTTYGIVWKSNVVYLIDDDAEANNLPMINITDKTASQWTKHTITFLTKDSLDDITPVIRFYSASMYSQSICMPKLEECERATQWQQNNADYRGYTGQIIRQRGEYSADETYVYNSMYCDVVLYRANTDENYKLYAVAEEGMSNTGIVPTNTAYWTPFDEFKAVATQLLLAKLAYINNLGVRNLLVSDADGSVYGGFCVDDNNGQDSTLGLGDIRLWLGGSVPTEAPFRVDKDGKVVMQKAEISGDINFTGRIQPAETKITKDNYDKYYKDGKFDFSEMSGRIIFDESLNDIIGSTEEGKIRLYMQVYPTMDYLDNTLCIINNTSSQAGTTGYFITERNKEPASPVLFAGDTIFCRCVLSKYNDDTICAFLVEYKKITSQS